MLFELAPKVKPVVKPLDGYTKKECDKTPHAIVTALGLARATPNCNKTEDGRTQAMWESFELIGHMAASMENEFYLNIVEGNDTVHSLELNYAFKPNKSRVKPSSERRTTPTPKPKKRPTKKVEM